jgi:hypothetical protein
VQFAAPRGQRVGGKTLRENLTPTQHGVGAKPARYDEEPYAPSRQRQVTNAAMVATVNAAGDGTARRAIPKSLEERTGIVIVAASWTAATTTMPPGASE